MSESDLLHILHDEELDAFSAGWGREAAGVAVEFTEVDGFKEATQVHLAGAFLLGCVSWHELFEALIEVQKLAEAGDNLEKETEDSCWLLSLSVDMDDVELKIHELSVN